MSDAVILWVDGTDPLHLRKRERFAAETAGASRHGSAPTRFADNNEIAYCIRSIRRFAPWIETIHLVTDAQRPRWLTETVAAQLDVAVVDHRELFGAHPENLPTFNSRSLDNLLHNIPNLSSRFLYLNDDFFFVAEAVESDFFQEGRPVLRGQPGPVVPRLVGQAADEAGRLISQVIPGVYRDGYVGPAAEDRILVAMQAERFFLAHAPVPIDKPSFAETMARFDGEANARFRFRSANQFRPIALWASRAINQGQALAGPFDWEYIHPAKHARPIVAHRLNRCRTGKVKSLCIQSLDQAPEGKRRMIFDFLDKHIGRF